MTETWLREAVVACCLPSSPSLSELSKKISMVLPIRLLAMPGLTCGMARDWLDAKGREHGGLPRTSRRLHGCMVAHAGWGALFYDARDEALQQRFTLVHEVAHFVLDHHLPRARAFRSLGEEISPALDEPRDAAPHESLFLTLQRIPSGAQVRFIERNVSGDPCTGKAMESELRADRLTYELLAPAREALPLVRDLGRQEAERELASRFGLPMREARTYVRLLLAREPARRPFFLKFTPTEDR
ncbi:ImmA/IrrE family metallo-endopeptidase [Archangium violaceum]|uniref:ImmA/IrrE family metallo-endopeptidase n=1 Tax=Archangium violaceum TaxID=83451 RepID=UPI00069835C0|nr:ImmA/IrrE family metallo-endopeptidase [Archangium violaceum]